MAMKENTIEDLTKRGCKPCEGDVALLPAAEINRLRERLGHGWEVINQHHLEKEFKFENFRKALDFVIKVGELAETQSHHPDIYLAWGKAKITIWTHKIDGLTESDFALAALVEQLEKP